MRDIIPPSESSNRAGSKRPSRKSGDSRVSRLQRKTLIFLGAVLIVFVVAPLTTYGVWQIQAQRAIAALADDNQRIADLEIIDDDEREFVPEQVRSTRTLRIASANITMPISVGSEAKLLLDGAWKPLGVADPGETGNMIIFGHRFLKIPPSKNTMFNLHQVKIDDVIDVDWDGESYQYRVTSTEVIQPQRVSVLEPTEDSTLTLITCTPIFSTKNRLIVTATLIE